MVPRNIGHIWIGPHDPPEEWLKTWRDAHPSWRYRLYDNAYLQGRTFRNQVLINEYYRRGKWAGVADLMRYEILLDEGGFLPEADSVCLHPVDALFNEDRLYTVYEFPEGRTGLMSPFLASNPGNPILAQIIETLHELKPEEMNSPWTTTGNGFLRRFFRAHPDLKKQVTIFPSHYFIPEHYKGEPYTGTDRIYGRQLWGTTRGVYPHSRVRRRFSTDPKPVPEGAPAPTAAPAAAPAPSRRLKVLFCGAHPDDAEIFFFGTLITYREAGAEISIFVATKGDGGSAIRSPHQPLHLTRRQEAQKGAATIGAALDIAEFSVDTLVANGTALVDEIRRTIKRVRPDIIFTHSPADYHPDHRALSGAVTLAAVDRVPVAYCDTLEGHLFHPTHYVDITDQFTRKLAAISLHHSQMPRRYRLKAKALAHLRARQMGRPKRLAEAFQLAQTPKFMELGHLLPPGVIVPQQTVVFPTAQTAPAKGREAAAIAPPVPAAPGSETL